MKKLFILALALATVLSLAGCYRANMLFADDVKTMEVEVWAIVKDDTPSEEVPPTCGETPTDEVIPDWGIALSAKDVTPKGMTLVIAQNGGAPTGELTTGDPYALHRPEGDTWVEVPQIRDDIAWNDVAYLIPMGGELEQELNWSWIYGELEAGKYMLTKQVMDFRGAGAYDTFTYGVEFTVE